MKSECRAGKYPTFINMLTVSVLTLNNVECRVIAELAYIYIHRDVCRGNRQASQPCLSRRLQSAVTAMTGDCLTLTVGDNIISRYTWKRMNGVQI